MSSDFDASEFVDDDFQKARKSPGPAAPSNPFGTTAQPPGAERAPTPEEIAAKNAERQQQLAAIEQQKQELQRERAEWEEVRRRQTEFHTGREEMIQHLTRGIGLLEEAEFSARREAEQMAKSLIELREALSKVQAIQHEGWTTENMNVELTRALTIVENARMEWNSARLKFSLLEGAVEAAKAEAATPGDTSWPKGLEKKSLPELCKLGLALTWPLALPALGIFILLLLQRIL